MSGKRFLALLIVLFAVPGAAHAQTSGEELLRQFLADIDAGPHWSAEAEAIWSDGERTIAEGLTFRATDGERAIALERLSFDNLRERSEGGFEADAARADGVAITAADSQTTIPTVEASRLAIPDLTALRFDPDQPVLFLSKLYAAMAEAEIARLAAPVLEVRQTIEAAGGIESDASLHYSDLVLESWAGGVIRSLRAGPLLIQYRTQNNLTRIEIASAETRRLDVGTIAHVFDPAQYRGGRGDRVWRSAIDSVLYTDIRITDEDETTVRIGGIGMTDLDLRQPERPFTPLIERAMAEPEMESEEEEALARELGLSLLQSFRLGDLWVEGLQVEGDPDDASGALRRFVMTGISAQGIDRIALEGFHVTAPDAVVSLGSFEIAGLVFPDLDAIVRAAELGAAENGELGPEMVPHIARLLIERVAVTADGIGPITLDSYLGEAERSAGAIPAYARGALSGLTIPSAVLNADPETAGFFRGLDIDSVTIDLEGEGRYDEADGRIRSAMTISARDLTSLSMEADLVGLTDEWIRRYGALAAEDSDAALALLSELRLVGLAIEVDDVSMVDRGFAFAAGQQGRDPAEFREEIRGALPFLLGFLTDPIFRADIARALQSFLEGGRRLSLRIEPPEPVPLTEIMAAVDADPQGLPGLLGATVESGE
jgi:hypothetical protein